MSGAGPSGAQHAEQLNRKVQKIQEVFPDHGAGFLAACLSACGQDEERVIHQLLEGSLPPELSRLDPKMPLQPPVAQSKGKGKADADLGKQLITPLSY